MAEYIAPEQHVVKPGETIAFQNELKRTLTDYIERKRLLREAETCRETTDAFIELVEAQPAADVRLVVRGRWITVGKQGGKTVKACSVCNHGATSTLAMVSNFCMNCGADMRGVDSDSENTHDV